MVVVSNGLFNYNIVLCILSEYSGRGGAMDEVTYDQVTTNQTGPLVSWIAFAENRPKINIILLRW